MEAIWRCNVCLHSFPNSSSTIDEKRHLRDLLEAQIEALGEHMSGL